MCLIALALNQHADWPFVLVANRDEFYSRPTRALGFWTDTPIIAGRDERAGGTWMGLSRDGRFAAVTNYRDGRSTAERGPSRGALVTDCLLSRTPTPLYRPDSAITAGYNLLWGDHQGLFYTSNRGAGSRRLSPGIYTLSNALLDTPWPKTRKAQTRIQRALTKPELQPQDLLEALSDDTPAPDRDLPDTGIPLAKEKLLSSCFIHSEDYGTRATTVVMQDREGNTRIIERRYDHDGYTGQSDFEVRLPPLGA